MPTTFRVKMNLEKVSRTLKAGVAAVTLKQADLRAGLVAADTEFRKDMVALFASQGASGGRRWPDLDEDYLARKMSHGPRGGFIRKSRRAAAMQASGRGVLVDTGGLQKSLVKLGAQHVARVTVPRFLIEFGTRNPLAAYHIKGSRNLPKRNPIQTTQTQRNNYGRTARIAMKKSIRARLKLSKRAT